MIEFSGTATNEGYIVAHDPDIWLKVPHLAGKKLKITIQEVRARRSILQNRYYFGIVIDLICKELRNQGHDVDKKTTHEWLLSKFNYKELVNESTGEIEKIPQRSKELSKDEFFEYVEKCRRFAAELLSINIPDPGEQLKAV